MAVAVTDDHIRDYFEDGVVCLRQAIAPEWIATLSAGLDRSMADPSERSRVWDTADDGSAMYYDSQAWRTVPEYRDFVLQSPMAELAGRVMGVEEVNFFFDAMFVRTGGSQFRTPFHQDEPYWSVEGFDCCSAWMPLVPVAKKSALEFVGGSHRWGHQYFQENFGALTGDERDQVTFDSADDERRPFPDIEGERDSYEILSWDMEPGDVAFFNARTIHGGSGNLEADQELRVFNTKWLGEQVRVCFRQEGMDPDHQQVMTEVGLAPGDRVGGDLYPLVWQRGDA